MKIDATVGDYQSDYLGKLIEKLQTRVPGRYSAQFQSYRSRPDLVNCDITGGFQSFRRPLRIVALRPLL